MIKSQDLKYLILKYLIIISIVITVITSRQTREAISTKTIEEHPVGVNRLVTNFPGYPPFSELFFAGGKGYEFRNKNSNKVLIILTGSTWGSAFGTTGSMLYFLDRYNIFMVERFDRRITHDYRYDIEERERYYIGNLLINYYRVVSEYLSQNNYDSIVIFGHSEGAWLLPMLYSKLDNPNITALVSSAGGGGLTRFKQLATTLEKFLSEEEPFASFNASHRRRSIINLTTFLRLYERKPFPNSTASAGDSSDMTFKWLNSIMHLNLFEYYENIDIPMLFLHGEMDMTVPVETTRHIEKNLPHKPFAFIYYPNVGHFPPRGDPLRQFQRDIAEWLLLVDP